METVARLAYVWWLLSAPDVMPPATVSPRVREDLRSLCVRLELLDHRDYPLTFASDEAFSQDIAVMRIRYTTLKHAPPIHDCMRFTTTAAATEAVVHGRRFREVYGFRQSLEPHKWWQYNEVLCESESASRVWELVRDAANENHHVTTRRSSLASLKFLLGSEDYYAGRLPPPIPVHRLRYLD